jgi:hypothetical protein
MRQITRLALRGQWILALLISFIFSLPAHSSEITNAYLTDTGAVFGDRGNGQVYGWSELNTNSHDRQTGDPRYATLIKLNTQQPSSYMWEIAVPNGEYEVYLVMGDAQYTNQINAVSIEGIDIEDPDGEDHFDEYIVTVSVTDGRLTIAPTSESVEAKVCFVEITPSADACLLTVEIDPADGGTTNPTAGEHAVAVGTPVAIEAMANPGFVFANWTVIAGCGTIADANSPDTSVTVGGICGATVQANYVAQAILTLEISDPAAGDTIPTSGNHIVNVGQVTEITAYPTSGFIFVNWTVLTGNVLLGDANSANASVIILDAGGATIMANFVEETTLTMATNDPSGGTTAPAFGGHPVGIGVPTSITANSNDGYMFLNWTFTGNALIGNSLSANAIITVLDSDGATVQANFVQLGPKIKINFQPTTSSGYADYLVDSGNAYGDRGNGHNYGWNVSNVDNTRDRNSAGSPDERYDTLNHLLKTENYTWEIDLANGTYQVWIVAGDPDYYNSIYKIKAEDVMVVDGIPTDGQRWIEGRATIEVSDGRLTLTNGAGADINKICFIEMQYLPGGGELPTVAFTAAAQSASEGAGTAIVTVQLSAVSDDDVTVPFTAGGTATNPSDYTMTASPITIPAGSTTGTATVTIVDDALAEADETVIVTMGAPVNAVAGATTVHTLTINDNDAPPSSGTMAFPSAAYSLAEDGMSATITVKRSGGSHGAASVQYATSDGTATAGTDYTAASGTLNWADGDAEDKTFSIAITNDDLGEEDETVNLALDNAAGASLGVPDNAVLTIMDDDTSSGGEIIKINFQAESSPGYSGYLADLGATYGDRGNGYSYGWDAHNAENARDRDSGRSPDERYDTLNHLHKGQGYTWEIGLANGTYRVRAVAGDPDYYNSIYSIMAENVLVVDGAPTSDQRWIEGVATVGVADGRLTLTNGPGADLNKICFIEITDLSENLPTVEFATTTQAVPENAGDATIVVNLSTISEEDVTVPFTVTGTATGGGADYSITASPITIPAGSISANITVAIVDDALNENPDETVIITMDPPTNATRGATTVHTLTITDNDGVSSSMIVATAVFYNNSAWDGNSAAANPSDDAAIATDKAALLPGGTATFANYTSFSKGLNGIMVDIANLAGTPTAADFTFKVGNDSTPAAWPDAAAPTAVATRSMGGGITRVTLVWADNAIAKAWLQVTVKATAQTGLATPYVFYLGNAVGECGNSVADALVNASDQLGARNNPKSLGSALVTDRYDYNRDKNVNSSDQLISRNNATSVLTAIKLIIPE